MLTPVRVQAAGSSHWRPWCSLVLSVQPRAYGPACAPGHSWNLGNTAMERGRGPREGTSEGEASFITLRASDDTEENQLSK